MACGRAVGRARWSGLAYSPCPAFAGEGEDALRRRRVPRVLGPRAAVERLRRGGCVPASRRPVFEGRRCPARPSARGRLP
eukprot:11175416-Lingulodinium_polyedra.AAC.1